MLICLNISTFVWLCSLVDGEICQNSESASCVSALMTNCAPLTFGVCGMCFCCLTRKQAPALSSVSGCFPVPSQDFSRWQQCLFHKDQPDVSVPGNSVWTVKDLWRSLLCNENCLIRCSRNSVYTQWRVVWSYQTGLVNERHGLMSSSVKVRARVKVF